MTNKFKVGDIFGGLGGREAAEADMASLRAMKAANPNTSPKQIIEKLVWALEPFANEAALRSHLALGPDIDEWPIGGNSLTFGDLRKALEALTAAQQWLKENNHE